MNSDLTIVAVFATMNRAPTALTCVQALAAQSRPPSRVIVADNCSTDDTVIVLEKLGNLPFELVVHRMPENRGNAGGVEVAMDRAFGDGADAVWILDDDSWPREAALAALLDEEWSPQVVRHPLQIDPETGKFTWPLQIDDGHGGWHLIYSEQELPDGPKVRSRIAWTGALVPREVRDRVGPVNGELFIRGEDEEYPWRFEQAGVFQEAIRNAMMDHPGPKNLIHWQFLRKNFFYESGLADWKLYYKIRNMVWLKRKQFGNLRAACIAATYTVSACWFDGPTRLPLLLRAVSDGWNGKLGKMKEPAAQPLDNS